MTSICEASSSPSLKSLFCCAICSNFFVDPVAVTPCGHMFCRKCIAAVIELGIPAPGGSLASKSKSPKAMKRKNCCPVCSGPAFLWTLSRVYLFERLLLVYAEHVAKQKENEPLSPYYSLQSTNFAPGDAAEVPLGQLHGSIGVPKKNATSGAELERDMTASPSRTKENSLRYTNSSPDTCGPHTEKKNFLRWDFRTSPRASPLEEATKEGALPLGDVQAGFFREKLPLLSELTSIIEEEDRILLRLKQKLRVLAENLEGVNLSTG